MFNDKQIQILSYQLEQSRIKTRNKGGIDLSYLEGHDVIETANKIFGFGYWDYTISKLEQVSQETNQNQNIVICYKAVVQMRVYDLQHSKYVSREDVGFGTGVSKTLADAHEGAAKEAVTDALKRAMRSFGNQFGNSLYDKSRNQSQQQRQPTAQQHTQQHHQYNKQHTPLPQDYTSLYNLGLSVVQQENNLIVTGENDAIFASKDSIKAYGFRWDGRSKCWYRPIEQQAA